MGTCTSDPAMKRGDYFIVRDGDISLPENGHICLYALQNLLTVITPKEREIAEAQDEDWMWRVRHVQCPDPKGRVIFTVDRVRKLEKRVRERSGPLPPRPAIGREERPAAGAAPDAETAADAAAGTTPANGIRDLRVVVEQVKGRCTSGLRPGDHVVLRGGRLSIPAGRHFCLYALQAVLPLLPAKQRRPAAGDWMAEEHHVICPDPAGNVILRIEPER
jgi:uncharacterized repeat protein (TIGR04076 family)